MAFVLPVSNSIFPGSVSGAYNSKVIHISRQVKHYCKYILTKRKPVRFVHPEIEYLGEAYFAIIKQHICIHNFYCYKYKRKVSLNFCLLTCRWSQKSKCSIFKKLAWGCLACPHGRSIHTCTIARNCNHKRDTYRWISLYYSDLLKIKTIILHLTYRKSRNYYGNGPQLFDSIGHPDLHKLKERGSVAANIAASRARKLQRKLRRERNVTSRVHGQVPKQRRRCRRRY